MESLMHYLWKYRLYEYGLFKTTKGETVEIIDPGIHNTDAGPDFFNAKVRIGNTLWAGNVEIHVRSSDWYKHGHDRDAAYTSVILHVVELPDQHNIQDNTGRILPQWVMKTPRRISENYHFLLNNDLPIPCLPRLRELPSIYLSDWKEALLYERLMDKCNRIATLLRTHQNDWNAVFYIILSRSFGFGINSEAFECLARAVPYRYAIKHVDSQLQMEALFFGQAGLLDETNDDTYYRQLQSEYIFLKKKYRLHALPPAMFRSLRTRPGNFPHVRIAQLVNLVRQSPSLFSQVVEQPDTETCLALFRVPLKGYWETHYVFGKTIKPQNRSLSVASGHNLLINTVVPVLFAYGMQKAMDDYRSRAIRLLESLPPEQNHISRLFAQAGVELLDAGDSQAMIQLKRNYCERKKCVFCRIGHKLLSE